MARKKIIKFLVILLLSLFGSVTSSVDLTDFFPFDSSDGATSMAFHDDTYEHVTLFESFKFLGRDQTDIYISSNGIIIFENETSTSTPKCSRTSDDVTPKVMPFWADAVRGDGSSIMYMQTQSISYLSKAKTEIEKVFALPPDIQLSWMFIVTFVNLAGYDMSHMPRNTFQAALVSDSTRTHSFVIFYYNKIQWVHQDSKQPSVGFDPGHYGDYFVLPTSCTPAIRNVSEGSNFGEPGKFVYKVDTKVQTKMSCSELLANVTALNFNSTMIPIMGNVPIVIDGFCADTLTNVSITCTFHDTGRRQPIQTKGILPTHHNIICPVPFLQSLGRMKVDVVIKYVDRAAVLFENFVHVVNEHDFGNQPLIFINKTQEQSLLLTAHWNPDPLEMHRIRELDAVENHQCEINGPAGSVEIVLLEYDGKNWADLGAVTKPSINSGVLVTIFDASKLTELTRARNGMLRTFAIKSKYTFTTSKEVIETTIPASIPQSMQILANHEQKFGNETSFEDLCKSWFDQEPFPVQDTLLCPRTAQQVKMDWRFALDKNAYFKVHGTSYTAYMQLLPSGSGSGAQCIYDEYGTLATLAPFGGNLQRKSPGNWRNYFGQYRDDIFPYLHCCKWISQDAQGLQNCKNTYYTKRPNVPGGDYNFPFIAKMVGQGHVTTFDGLDYTFLRAGEFILINHVKSTNGPYHSDEFVMHVGIQMGLDDEPSFTFAMSSVVMKQKWNGEEIKVQVHSKYLDKGLYLNIDDDLVEADDRISEQNLYYTGLVIQFKSKHEILLNFAIGFSFRISNGFRGEHLPTINILAIADSNLKPESEGLWGNMDGNEGNDFTAPDGSTLPLGATLWDTSSKFGMFWKVDRNDSLFSDGHRPPLVTYLSPVWYRTYNFTSQAISGITSGLEFCGEDDDCKFDYRATSHKPYAEATKASNSVFSQLEQASDSRVQSCPRVSIDDNGRVILDSHNVGAVLQILCNNGYEIYPGVQNINYTCSEVQDSAKKPNTDGDVTLEWSHPTLGVNPSLTCKSKPQPNNPTVSGSNTGQASGSGPTGQIQPGKSVANKLKSSTTGTSHSNSVSLLLAAFGVMVTLIVVTVLIMKFPPCEPVKQKIWFEYRRLRSQ